VHFEIFYYLGVIMTISSDIVVVYEEKTGNVQKRERKEKRKEVPVKDENINIEHGECNCYRCLNSGSDIEIKQLSDNHEQGKRLRKSSPIISKEEATNLSISLLDLPFKIGQYNEEKNLQYLNKFKTGEINKINDKERGDENIVTQENAETLNNNIFGNDVGINTLDHVFIPYHFLIPDTLKKYRKYLQLNFDFHGGNSIIIKNLESQTEESFPVLNCITELKSLRNYKTERLIFLHNLKNLEKQIKKKENSNFLSSLENRTQYQSENEFSAIKQELFSFQMVNKVNFIHIENANDILIALKNIIRYKEAVFVPKVKKCKDKNKFLMNLLEFIPGVSKNVSRAIVNTYKSLNDIVKCENFCDIEVFNDEGSSFRLVGKRQSDLIRKVFDKASLLKGDNE
ncbi:hypothetical protein THOM_1355, partial [Trachipleistophora hominis]